MTDTLNILICDDSALIRSKLKALLESNYQVTIRFAENGVEAVELYTEHKPDIVFMDIVMPGKSGIEALKEIKSINPNAKVVMASSVGTQSNLLEALKSGAFDFVQKPITEEMVSNVMKRILAERGHS